MLVARLNGTRTQSYCASSVLFVFHLADYYFIIKECSVGLTPISKWQHKKTTLYLG